MGLRFRTSSEFVIPSCQETMATRRRARFTPAAGKKGRPGPDGDPPLSPRCEFPKDVADVGRYRLSASRVPPQGWAPWSRTVPSRSTAAMFGPSDVAAPSPPRVRQTTPRVSPSSALHPTPGRQPASSHPAQSASPIRSPAGHPVTPWMNAAAMYISTPDQMWGKPTECRYEVGPVRKMRSP